MGASSPLDPSGKFRPGIRKPSASNTPVKRGWLPAIIPVRSFNPKKQVKALGIADSKKIPGGQLRGKMSSADKRSPNA